MRIHILPTGRKDLDHADRTLLNPVPQELLSQYLSTSDMQAIANVYQTADVPTWGWVPGDKNTPDWSDLQPGDIAIFVIPSNDQTVVTKVEYKVRSASLATRLWSTDRATGKTWELIFFVKILGALTLSKRELLRHLQYTNEKDNLQGHRDVTPRFAGIYGSIDNFLSINTNIQIPLSTVKEDVGESLLTESFPNRMSREERLRRLEEALNRQGQTPDEYVEVNGRRFKRSQIVVAFVKERDEYKCKACGWTLTERNGKKYIEAAHIVARAPTSGGVAGPDTPENMVALCPNCHKKLDKGGEKARNEVLEALRKNGVNV